MHIHRTNWFKWPIGLPVCVVICSLVGCRDASPVVYELQSSSMAPQFQGPRYSATCQNCDQSIEVAAELSGSAWPVRCPYCGGGCKVAAQLTRGDRIQIREESHLERMDVVAIQRHNQAVLLKRIWGLPGERVEIVGGEIVIDGQVFQKSLPQIRRVAVPLRGGDWTKKPSSRDSARETNDWQYKSPAPVYPDETHVTDWLVPAPIADELPGAPPTGKLAISEDVYLRIELQPSVDWIAVEYFYRGELRRVVLSSGDRPLAGGDALTASSVQVRLQPTATCELAFCDGRLLVGTGNGPAGKVVSLVSPLGLHEETPERHRNAEISVSSPTGAVREVEIFRDLIFRSTHLDPLDGEQYSALDSGRLFVLGDNQPISLDSRNEFGPVRRDEILGVVENVTSAAARPNR